jgi:O-antigen/teichoic acid export membrane protein
MQRSFLMIPPSDQDGTNAIESDSFGSRAKSGTLWLVAGFGLGQILRLLSNIALAAILFEEAFALMAIVTAVMMGIGMFSDFGLQANVVQNARGDEPDFVNTAWTLQVCRGVILFLVAAGIAWPLAEFYGANDPKAFDLLYLIPIVGLTALLEGFHSTKLMTAARHLKIKEVTFIELIVGPFHAIVMLALAWQMRSVYALAIASVLSTALRVFLGYRMLQGAPSRFCWDATAVRTIIHFGKWLFLSTLITFLAFQIDRLSLARLFSLAEVGVYSIAVSLALMVPTIVGKVQWSVLFPWYSRMLEGGMPFTIAFSRTRMAMMVFSTYLCTLLVSGAASFFELAYDYRYSLGSSLLPVLAFGAWFYCLENMYGSAFVASGRPKWTAMTNASKVVAFALLLVPIAIFDLDIVTAAYFLAGSEVVRWLVCHGLGRRLGLRNARAELGMLVFFLTASLAGWSLVEWAPVVSDLHPFARIMVLGVTITLVFSPLFLRYVVPFVKQR